MMVSRYVSAVLTILFVSLSASRARAATVTATGACNLYDAVTTLNNATNTGSCTHTGTWRSNDTISLGSQTYNISSDLDPAVSMTIAGVSTTASIVNWNGAWDGELFYLVWKPGEITLTLQNLQLKNSSSSHYVTAVFVSGNTTYEDESADANAFFKGVDIHGFTASAVIAYAPKEIWFADSSVHDNSSLTSNWPSSHPYGGAVQVYAWNYNASTRLQVDNSSFTNNSAQKGGAVYNEGTIQTTESATFENNHATVAGGGALYLASPSQLSGVAYAEIFSSVFEYNTCALANGGGAIASETLSVLFTSQSDGNGWVGYNTCNGLAQDVNWSPYTCYPTHSSICQ